MRILVISDTHDLSTPDLFVLESLQFEMIITLGDVNLNHLKYLKSFCSNIYGILGNHDCLWYLDEANIQNFDCKIIEIENITFAGFAGSWKYKESNDYCLLTDSESIEKSKKVEYADILFSHDTIKGAYKKSWSHPGLKEIDKYIKKHKPFLNIHGHHHSNDRKDFNGCELIGVFGISIIDIEKENGKLIVNKIENLLLLICFII